MIVTFLSDFGLQDDFVGTCHGVIKWIAPGADIIDIAHGIEPQQVLQGALVLANTIPYMPVGVHLAVVDPGVGSSRRELVLTGLDGRLYVGPDNGLLCLAAERLGGIASANELQSAQHRLQPTSDTFHGRDVFAPAAAYLATGTRPDELGPRIDPATVVRLDLPEPTVEQGAIGAKVLYTDRFGNAQLNVTRAQLELAGISPGALLDLELAVGRYPARATRTFADTEPGGIIVYEDAYGNGSIAIRNGSAAETLALRAGQELRIGLRS